MFQEDAYKVLGAPIYNWHLFYKVKKSVKIVAKPAFKVVGKKGPYRHTVWNEYKWGGYKVQIVWLYKVLNSISKKRVWFENLSSPPFGSRTAGL